MKVVTVQSDPGGSGVGNVYRLGWKEECVDDADDACEVRARSDGVYCETAEMNQHETPCIWCILPAKLRTPICRKVISYVDDQKKVTQKQPKYISEGDF